MGMSFRALDCGLSLIFPVKMVDEVKQRDLTVETD